MRQLVFIVLAASAASTQHGPKWDYQGDHNPASWGKDYPTCGLGKIQSPIDLKAPFASISESITPAYKEGPLTVENNGHTIEVWIEPGSKLTVARKDYDLLRFHFHRPSEETINGKPTAMVAHFVHQNKETKKLLVVGVMLNEGKENPTIRSIWSAAPKKEGSKATAPGGRINPAALLPASLAYYRYEGSLTTPPCTEGVTFYILKSPVNISKAQVDAFPFRLNARPVQKQNGRVIYSYN